ncbi:unnamed protein product [Symbiodinium sp. CCMP2592]|nr:unnamed protein product [Symbiodinium sp. CCMP2592]
MGTSAKDKIAYEALMSEDSRYFQDQQAQTEHIGRRTSMLSAHLNETKPTYDVMAFQVSSLMESLNKQLPYLLGPRFRSEEREAPSPVAAEPGTPKKATNLQEMKVHIMGLRRLLDKEGAAHMHKLEAVQKNLKEVKQQTDKAAGSSISKIVDQTSVLEKSASIRGMLKVLDAGGSSSGHGDNWRTDVEQDEILREEAFHLSLPTNKMSKAGLGH